MIGCYDFCGHYEWTFDWLERMGGHELVREFWREAIGGDSQRHARELIERKGIAGMVEYWGHTLAEEAGDQGYSITSGEDFFRIDVQLDSGSAYEEKGGGDRCRSDSRGSHRP